MFDSSATPSAGQLVFVRNKSNMATSDSFGTGTIIAAGDGALYVYTGSAWERHLTRARREDTEHACFIISDR